MPRSRTSLARKITSVCFLAWFFVLSGAAASWSETSEKPFFPIGIYSVNPPAVFPEIKRAGFNTVHTYEAGSDYLKEYVSSARKAGLKVLIYPGDVAGRPKGRGFDPARIRPTAGELSKSDALLAWYLCDEPDTMGVSTTTLGGLRALLASLDPHHPAAGTVWKPRFYSRYARSYDIFIVDPYPIPAEPLTMVSMRIDLARKAVGDNLAIWALLQAFGRQNEHNDGWGWKRAPNEAELRAMTWLSVVHGVQGIFYYTYHGSRFFIEDSPAPWESLKRVVGELNDNYALLTSKVSREVPFRINGKVHYTVRNIEQGDKNLEAGPCLISVNTSPFPQNATYVLSEDYAPKHELVQINGHQIIEKRKGYFPDLMAPFGVEFYKLR